MMAKKQKVVNETFELDLSNLGAYSKKSKEVEEKKETLKVEKGRREATQNQKPERKQKPKVVKKEQLAAAIQKQTPSIENELKDKSEKAKRHLRLVISKASVEDFDALFKNFVEQSETYFVNTSRVHVFVLGTLYLEEKYIKAKSHFKAPPEFVKFVSRKGMRPKTDEAILRKTEATPMFFELNSEVFDAYFNIMYSFLVKNDDVRNLSYSGSYFFKDFLDLLNSSFKSFCIYGQKHS